MHLYNPNDAGYALIELQHGERETKQVALLLDAGKAFVKASEVAMPAIAAVTDASFEEKYKLKMGLQMLEEAMAAHKRYLDSLK